MRRTTVALHNGRSIQRSRSAPGPADDVGSYCTRLKDVPHLLLRTFQSLNRITQLQHNGTLVGSWDRVLPGTEDAYLRMVEVMTEHGIDTGGCPPVWAWSGALRLADADSLFNAEHELSGGFATVTFRAPQHLVLLCDYEHWCDALMPPADAPIAPWQPKRRDSGSRHPEQACLPHLRLEWVRTIQLLPTSGWDSLDLETLL